MYYRITKQGKAIESPSVLVNCLFRNAIYIFCSTFLPVIISLRKVLKEIHNIAVSHLLTPAVLRVIAFHRSQTTLKEENNTSEWQWIWHSDANPVEPRLTVHRSSIFLRGLFLQMIEGLFSVFVMNTRAVSSRHMTKHVSERMTAALSSTVPS